MALTHEIGIIDHLETSYDDYTPKKYHCISVNDASIQALLPSPSLIKTYFSSLEQPDFGLDYYGVTIIPVDSLSAFLDSVSSAKGLKQEDDVTELCKLIIQAKKENKYMIHYGI
ncbi:hypothetical protein [Enterococcus sp. AZ196]|uniref:hypothetical protein n=1 Tax=Enterococcus sp. AZ196 TaxID=2774659 RepID=UPI003D2C796B